MSSQPVKGDPPSSSGDQGTSPSHGMAAPDGSEVGKEAVAVDPGEMTVVEDHFSNTNKTNKTPPLPSKHEDAVKVTSKEEAKRLERKRVLSVTPATPPLDPAHPFPLTNYYELEGRVHAENWSIPIKPGESLGKCLVACIAMARDGMVIEQEEPCRKFLEKTLPLSFERLLTTDAVLRWDSYVQEGILDMTRLFVELIAVRLKLLPVPLALLDHLAMIFNADINYHVKNRPRRSENQYWQRKLDNKVFAVCPSFASFKDPKGWLVDLMNTFSLHGGLEAIRSRILDSESLSIQELTALLQPFGGCEEYINTSFFKDHFGECVTRAVKFVESMSEADLKHKEAGSVSLLLRTVKTLCLRFWSPDSAHRIDVVRLDITLRMLKTPHFNAKMNALKEVAKLIEEPSSPRSRGVKNPISKDRILEWLVANRVLSIALTGNLHQSQYTNKLKSLLETVGTRLSLEDLDAIWEQQVDKNPTQVENVHNVLAAAASRFTPQHLDHLFTLIQRSWETGSDRYRVGLLKLIGRIGRDDRTGKTATKILDLLWGLSHTPQLSTEMADQALEAHLSILTESTNSRDSEKRHYIVKCVDNIKKEVWVVPAFRQLYRIMKGISRSGSRSYQPRDQLQISDLRKQYDLLKLTTSSLTRWQSKAQEAALAEGTALGPDLLVDGRYKHSEFVSIQLKFLSLLAQEGGIYLPLKRAIEVWDTLITNSNSCHDDHHRAFRFFDSGLADFDTESQYYIFVNRMIKMDPVKVDMAGYVCFKIYFEAVNVHYRKVRKVTSQGNSHLIVESTDLLGGDYLWKACLEVTEDDVAMEIVSDILQTSYSGLDTKLKRDSRSLHARFLDNCFSRIKLQLRSQPIKELSGDNPRSRTVKRLLVLLQKYISLVEDLFHMRRAMPPHGTSFQGHPVSLSVRPEAEKLDFRLQCHSNESWGSIRQRVAKRLKLSPEQLQIGVTERWLGPQMDNRLLHQLGLKDEDDVIVKKLHQLALSRGAGPGEGGLQGNQAAQALKEERALPGILLASFDGLFAALEELACTANAEITAAVRSLLMLLPTNPQILRDTTAFAESDHLDSSGSQAIEKLFDPRKNSPTQLLYNFEVLSSRVLPVHGEEGESGAGDFKSHFLQCGGLRHVLSILHRDALPANVELGIRQDCYAITLSLARFLLCNQTSLPTGRLDVLKRTGSIASTPTRPQASATPTQEVYDEPSDGEEMVTDIDTLGGGVASGGEGRGKDQRGDEMARLTIETMHVDDFSTMLSHLIVVAWAAAAGRLHLAGSENDSEPRLVLGLCALQRDVSGKDAAVARAALELLVTCLELRPSLLGVFFSQKQVGEFVVDVLVGSAHAEVRTAACVLFGRLCKQGPSPGGSPRGSTGSSDHQGDSPSADEKKLKLAGGSDPRKFFIHTLLKVRIPVWTFSPLRSELDSRWRANCLQYFDLLCELVEGLSVEDQQLYAVEVGSLLQSELLLVEDVYKHRHINSEMQNLVAGHLNFLRALYSCVGVAKADSGPRLVQQLLTHFLFPASSHMLDDGCWGPSEGVLDFSPVCEDVSRVAAFKLLSELADGCHDTLSIMADSFTRMHHMEKPYMAKEWEFQPPVIGRAQCGFVGLRNGGATCYMNSVLQQLYMQPLVQQVILTSDISESSEGNTILFLDLQKIFGHLLGSKLQYFTPDGFWKTFKLWGQPVNIREQQDAFEFFSNLAEQTDEVLKKNKLPQVFSKTFGGVFRDEKICRGCEHRYDREEPFQSISLAVATKQLEEALKEYFKGELLEGDNAYLCEKCDEKRDTLKRTVIKSLPPVMIIHLKRFGYDWEANRAIKCDDHFEFPLAVDMLPYTSEGLEGQDEEGEGGEVPKNKMYQLTGIVVHSGQASAGHYYSFIKQKRETDGDSDRWYRFNDNLVDEVVMDAEMLEVECFGGTYKSSTASRQESRTRFWNAYMLFYQAVDKSGWEEEVEREAEPPSPLPTAKEPLEGGSPLEQLGQLVLKGEGRRVFAGGMPPLIQRSINEDNLLFTLHQEVYNPAYWRLVKDLVDANLGYLVGSEGFPEDVKEKVALDSFKLGVNFLLHTYIRTKKKLRCTVERDAWLESLTHLMTCCPATSKWLLELLSVAPGQSKLQGFLLDCPSPEMRFLFTKLLLTAIEQFFAHGGVEEGTVDRIVESLMALLHKEVVDCYRHSAQYFELLRQYSMHEIGGPHLLRKDGLIRFITFLLEPPIQTQQPSWAPQQVREFRTIFAVVGNLVRQTNLSSFCKGEAPDLNPYRLDVSMVEPSAIFSDWYKKQDETRKFVKELVLSLREADALACDAISSTLCYCCYDNEALSAISLDDLMFQVAHHTSNELKQYYKVLMDIMLVKDAFQLKRIKYTIEGAKVKPDTGVFIVMDQNRNKDSRRTYQAVKFTIQLANKCPEACTLISKHYDKWQWSVDWLKKKIKENYSSPAQTATIVSNDTSSSRTFQRTISAQNTLEEATVLLSEIESQEQPKGTDSQLELSENESRIQNGTVDESVIG